MRVDKTICKCRYCGEIITFAGNHICINYKDIPKITIGHIKTARINKNIYKWLELLFIDEKRSNIW